MSQLFRLIAVAAALSLAAGCAKKEGADASGLDTDAKKFGYTIGVDLGRSLQAVKDDVDLAALKQGIDDVYANPTDATKLKLDDKAREEVKQTVAKKMQERQVAERDAKSKQGTEEGAKFLAENGKKEGVKTTASGLQYEVLTEGKGAHPKASDRVTVHYKGTLLNGETFDSSYDRGQPVTFPLSNVIPGWTEGLQLMTPGAKYKLYIPSNLGYGDRGAGAKIGPNATLVFEVELISIEKDGAKK